MSPASTTHEDLVFLAKDTIHNQKQAIIFAESKAAAEKAAEVIASTLAKNESCRELADQVANILHPPTKQCLRLGLCMQKGIAFHHSGLEYRQREKIENAFREGIIRIICSTPTLAAGLDLPAYRVVIKSVYRFSPEWGRVMLPVLEIHQMEGRAGRPKYDTQGESVFIAKSEPEKEKIYEEYICGLPEDIVSKLGVEPVLRSMVLGLLASQQVNSVITLRSFFTETFWAHQYGNMTKLELILSKVIDQLEKWEFVEVLEDKLVITAIGQRVAELYVDPYTAHHLITCLRKAAQPSAFALFHMIGHTLEIRPYPTITKKEDDVITKTLLQHSKDLLEPEPGLFDIEYEEYHQAVKIALILQAWTSERNEESILTTYGVRPGDLRVKINIAEWLMYSCSELAKLLGKTELARLCEITRIQIAEGVSAELLPLLKLKGIGRVRARKLFNNGIRHAGDVKKTAKETLSQLLGSGVAAQLKVQVEGPEDKSVPISEMKGVKIKTLHDF